MRSIAYPRVLPSPFPNSDYPPALRLIIKTSHFLHILSRHFSIPFYHQTLFKASSDPTKTGRFVYASIHPSMASKPASTALIIVDVQNDFLPPTGALAVPNGREVLPVITELLDPTWNWAVVLVSQAGILPLS